MRGRRRRPRRGSTVMRTSSEPARARAATCSTVAATSAVSVLVMDCTTIGAPPPTVTAPLPDPMVTAQVLRRGAGSAAIGVGRRVSVVMISVVMALAGSLALYP